MKPNPEIWARVNQALLGENAGEAIITIIDGLSSLLRASGIATSDGDARAMLAAMRLSPDTGAVGSLLPLLDSALARLGRDAYNPS